jgi:hypothetical protein
LHTLGPNPELAALAAILGFPFIQVEFALNKDRRSL